MFPSKTRIRDWLLLLALTAGGILVHGYHLGVEDQAIYLPAIKKNLDPTLYPHDSLWFLAQARWTLFDELVAFSIQVTRLPADVAIGIWQFLSVFLVLLSCRQLAQKCFPERPSQWAAVAAVSALLTLPVAGTRVLLVDQYLHPRTLATASLLFALNAILEGPRLRALLWIAVSAALHPQMMVLGAFHLAFQVWKPPRAEGSLSGALLCATFSTQPEPDAWREILLTRKHYFVLEWSWLEWAGVIGPVAILWWFARLGNRQNSPVLRHISGRLAISCALGTLAAVTMNVVPALMRLLPTQPMRQLHLVYVLMFFLAGGLVGQYVLRASPLRWAVLFLSVCGIMFYAQQRVFPASPHIEWPGLPAENRWVQAFDWIRQNTPRDALFALDPRHMARPGEDFHSFRGFAERSMLPEYFKDFGKAAIFPQLAATARAQIRDVERWPQYKLEDFQRLKEKYGVNWVVVEQPGVQGLPCPYENEAVRVCRIGE